MNRKIAFSDLSTTNATVEQVIKQLKSYHILVEGNETLDQARKILDQAIACYMSKPLDVHHGQSASEILDNRIADAKEQSELIQKANEQRRIQNRKFNCELCGPS